MFCRRAGCNVEFTPRKCYKPGASPVQVFCSNTCRARVGRTPGSKRDRREKALTTKRTCSECPTRFLPARVNQRCCSPACQEKRNRAGEDAYQRRQRLWEAQNRWRPCAWCAGQFQPAIIKRKRYCCAECFRLAHNSRQRVYKGRRRASA